MATIYDVKQSSATVAAQAAAEAHNAQIRERFQRLQSVERTQFAEIAQQSRASVLAPERPQQVQSPMQEVQERTVSPAFTPETLDRALQSYAPVLEKPAQTPVAAKVAKIEGVQLSRFAKTFLAACGAFVGVMICAICVLTQVINANDMKLSAMEAKNAQLRQEYTQVVAEKERLKSAEVVEEYAKSQGMVKVNW